MIVSKIILACVLKYLLNVNNNKKHAVRTIVMKILITPCIPLELRREHVTACRMLASHPLTIDMEAQVNVNHQLRALLPDLVNKWMDTNTCKKPSTSFIAKYVVRQMIFSTHCIVLKMTYDMRGFTYFLTCKVNIMPFFLLGSRRELRVSLNSHISMMNYLLVLPLRGEGSNKLRG